MLPSTPTLSGLGAAAGAGAGGLLGQALGAPREALTNLLGTALPFLGVQPGQGYESGAEAQPWDLVRTLPGLAGIAAGGVAAVTPGLAPFAGMIGTGVAGLSQMAGDVLAPEAVGAPTMSEIVRAMGVDPDTGGGHLASMLGSVALDPLTYMGALGGMHGGAAVGGARDALVAKEAEMAASAAKVEELRNLQKLADTAVPPAPPPWLEQLQEDLAKPPLGYRPDVMEHMPDLLANAGRPGKAYARVEPGLAQDLDIMGLASPTEQGGVQFVAGGPPAFAQVRRGGKGGGSSLGPTDARAQMLAGPTPPAPPPEGEFALRKPPAGAPAPDLPPGEFGLYPQGTQAPSLQGGLSNDPAAGPMLNRGRGYAAVLDDPYEEFKAMRGGAGGLDEAVRKPAPKVPSLMEALGDRAEGTFLQPDASGSMLDNPAALIHDFPVQSALWRDPVTMRTGNVANLPLPDARQRLSEMVGQAQAGLEGLGAQPVTPLQGMLRRMGLAP
jgi:hypothetical protein